ncbi:MAG: sulfotransferase family protein [Burkholderiales bacterium]
MRKPRLAAPVFVIGCSRSGTTVVYKTLSEASELGSLQRETHDFWSELHPPAAKSWATHALTAADASPLDRDRVERYFYSRLGARCFVDKNNQNGLCVPYLHALFPDARFVYVKRSPGDNIHSLIEGWGRSSEFATWSDTLPAEVRISGGAYRRWCFFLFDGWRDFLESPIENVCAAQYMAMNEAILSARAAIPAGQWTEIFYEDLVRDPVGSFRAVFDALGLRFGPHQETHCYNVLGTPYNAFSAIQIDKWKDQKNSACIERILPLVGAVARNMGYKLA